MDEGEAVLELPHEVEERYMKLLRRQEGRAKELTEKHKHKKRTTHKVMKVSSGYLKGSPLVSPRSVASSRPQAPRNRPHQPFPNFKLPGADSQGLFAFHRVAATRTSVR